MVDDILITMTGIGLMLVGTVRQPFYDIKSRRLTSTSDKLIRTRTGRILFISVETAFLGLEVSRLSRAGSGAYSSFF